MRSNHNLCSDITNLIEAHEKKIGNKENPNINAISDILSGKNSKEKNEYYSDLNKNLFGEYKFTSFKFDKGSLNDDTAKDSFDIITTTIGMTPTFVISKIHFDKLEFLAKKYTTGIQKEKINKNFYKAAICYALLIQFSNDFNKLQSYFEALSKLYSEGDDSFPKNEELSDKFKIKAMQNKPAIETPSSFGLPLFTREKNKISSELAQSILDMGSTYRLQINTIHELCIPNSNHLNYHKILGIEVEECLNKDKLNKKYNDLRKHYQNLMEKFVGEYKAIKENNPNFNDDIETGLNPIMEKFKNIILKIDESHQKLSEFYSIIYLNNSEKEYIEIQKNKSDLLEKLNHLKQNLHLRHKAEKSIDDKIKLHKEIYDYEEKIIAIKIKIADYKNRLFEKAKNNILSQTIPWNETNKIEIDRKNTLESAINTNIINSLYSGMGGFTEMIDKEPIAPNDNDSEIIEVQNGSKFSYFILDKTYQTLNKLNNQNRIASDRRFVILQNLNDNAFESTFNSIKSEFNALEKPYADGFNDLVIEVEDNIRKYKTAADKRFLLKNKKEHADSIAKIEEKAKKLTEGDIPSVKLNKLIIELENQRNEINKVHLYPSSLYRDNKSLGNETNAWEEFKAKLKSFFTTSSLEAAYQTSLDSILENKDKNQWELPSIFDYRKTNQKEADVNEYKKKKGNFQRLLKLDKSVQENIAHLFASYGKYFTVFFRNHIEDAKELANFFKNRSNVTCEEIKQKLDAMVLKCRKAGNFKENGLFACMLRFSMELVDIKMKLKEKNKSTVDILRETKKATNQNRKQKEDVVEEQVETRTADESDDNLIYLKKSHLQTKFQPEQTTSSTVAESLLSKKKVGR